MNVEWWWRGLSAASWLVGTLLLVAPFMEWLGKRYTAHHRMRLLSSFHRSEGGGLTLESFTWYRALADAVQIAGIGISAGFIVTVSAGTAVFSYFAAGEAVLLLKLRYALDADRLLSPHNPVLNGVVALLLGSLPVVYVLFKLQRKRAQMASAMIGAVQNLIGTYGGNLTLGDWTRKAEPTMPDALRSEWRRLCMTIQSRSTREALYDFAGRIGNEWTDDLADILLVRAESGYDVTKSLHKLVRDMQTAKSNEQKRLAMMSVYRIGTLFMVITAFFVIGFNIHADRSHYRYYFLEPAGKTLVVVSLLVLFASLLAVIHSGRKRM